MRWFFSMKRTIVSPSGRPRLSSSLMSDGRSTAFADTLPRYTPIHCEGYSSMRRGRSLASIAADFENSRRPLAISSEALPKRDLIGLSGSVIRTSLRHAAQSPASRSLAACTDRMILDRTPRGIYCPESAGRHRNCNLHACLRYRELPGLVICSPPSPADQTNTRLADYVPHSGPSGFFSITQ